MRRRSALQLVLIGLVAGGAAVAVALLIPWLPKPASKEAHRIDVTAVQFAWSFNYPEADNAQSELLRLPLGRSVLLDLTAPGDNAVIHSFWVPEFGQKQDVVPGLHPTLHITPNRLGTFPIICAELCGLGHGLMRSEAIVMSPAAFDRWLASQRKGATS